MKRLIVIAIMILLSSSIALAQNFCQGDFNYNGNVAAEDVEIFLEHFGRNQYNNPCPFDGPAPVAKTGQTTSYYEGDDGGRQKGLEWPMPRFLDEGDGTILDRLTGLRWLKNANCFGQREWVEALTDCNGLAHGQCGLTDGSSGGQWRLPNSSELESLRDLQYYEPALSNSAGTGQWTHGDPFINLITNDCYWASTSLVIDSVYAWVVHLRTGHVEYRHKIFTPSYVWPVRGGH